MSAVLQGGEVLVWVVGQSQCKAIGAGMAGLPAGFKIDFDKLKAFTQRRAPGNASFSTARKEADEPVILSGLCDGMTCGAPLGMLIENTNTRPGDYDNLRATPRPSRADFAAYVKLHGLPYVAGVGPVSDRLTEPP